MPRPRPSPRCDHVRSGARPHFAKGFCESCYRSHKYVARKAGEILSADDTPFTACPVRYCPQCHQRIGDGCPRCAPDWAGLLSPEERDGAAWAHGQPAGDPVLTRAEVRQARAWVARHGWRDAPGPDAGTSAAFGQWWSGPESLSP